MQGVQGPTGVAGQQVAPGAQTESQGPELNAPQLNVPQPQMFDVTATDDRGHYTVAVGTPEVSSGGLCGPPGLESSAASVEGGCLQGPGDVGGAVEPQSVEQGSVDVVAGSCTAWNTPVQHGHAPAQPGSATVQSGNRPVHVGSQFGIPPPPPGHPLTQFVNSTSPGPTWPQGACGTSGVAGPVPSLAGSGLAGLSGGGVGSQPVGTVPSQSDQVVMLLQQQVGQLQQQNNMLMQMLQQMMHQRQTQSMNANVVPSVATAVSSTSPGPTGGGSVGTSSGNPFKAVDSKLMPSTPTCDPGKWTTRPFVFGELGELA